MSNINCLFVIRMWDRIKNIGNNKQLQLYLFARIELQIDSQKTRQLQKRTLPLIKVTAVRAVIE